MFDSACAYGVGATGEGGQGKRSQYCKGWQETKGGTSGFYGNGRLGKFVPMDSAAACDTPIEAGQLIDGAGVSGYCVCKDGRKVAYADEGHPIFTCNDMCAPENAKAKGVGGDRVNDTTIKVRKATGVPDWCNDIDGENWDTHFEKGGCNWELPHTDPGSCVYKQRVGCQQDCKGVWCGPGDYVLTEPSDKTPSAKMTCPPKYPHLLKYAPGNEYFCYASPTGNVTGEGGLCNCDCANCGYNDSFPHCADLGSPSAPPNASVCHGWKCGDEGQYCPADVPGGAGGDGQGYCCKGGTWTPRKDGESCSSTGDAYKCQKSSRCDLASGAWCQQRKPSFVEHSKTTGTTTPSDPLYNNPGKWAKATPCKPWMNYLGLAGWTCAHMDGDDSKGDQESICNSFGKGCCRFEDHWDGNTCKTTGKRENCTSPSGYCPAPAPAGGGASKIVNNLTAANIKSLPSQAHLYELCKVQQSRFKDIYIDILRLQKLEQGLEMQAGAIYAKIKENTETGNQMALVSTASGKRLLKHLDTYEKVYRRLGAVARKRVNMAAMAEDAKLKKGSAGINYTIWFILAISAMFLVIKHLRK